MASGDSFGLCHICREERPIRFCRLCGHWFCASCQWRYWSRGLAAVKAMMGNPVPGCCGVMNDA